MSDQELKNMAEMYVKKFTLYMELLMQQTTKDLSEEDSKRFGVFLMAAMGNVFNVGASMITEETGEELEVKEYVNILTDTAMTLHDDVYNKSKEADES